jgi:hypothetical protein
MNKLLVAIIAGAFAVAAAAQTNAPKPTAKQRQSDVKATTEAGGRSSVYTQNTAKQQAENTAKSKEQPKMSKEEKSKLAKDATKMNVNPDNSAGQAATSREQKANVQASKGQPKANTELKTKEGKKELSKELQQKATQ